MRSQFRCFKRNKIRSVEEAVINGLGIDTIDAIKSLNE